MPDFNVLEPAIDPNNRIAFLLDWELTMKCNLDCSYCSTDLHDGGHNNLTPHPKKEECIQAIDFMFEYVDLYMKYKSKGLKYVILNVYGGESLYHPDIVEILQQVRSKYEKYSQYWDLTVTTTTNAIISSKHLLKIIPYIDEFTTSYHTEATDKQKQVFRNNLLEIKKFGKRLKCVVLMHQESDKFEDAQLMIKWLADNQIKVLPRQLDDLIEKVHNYNTYQVQWFNDLNQSRSNVNLTPIEVSEDEKLNLSSVGRACCGGRQMCEDQNYKNRKGFILNNHFTDWYCSVNHFFLFVKQVTGNVFVNKDCKMNFDSRVGPIGQLHESNKILANLKQNLDNKTLPIIQCKKNKCYCGLCAPKAKNLEDYQNIMNKYQGEYKL